mmetsp:Transcript_1584/g.5235  ORF Transcript_1584/g.5235 Transcript_1584/m.5235 type:complete len:254 (-) Transcript_1584:287-1048(-)
MPPKHIALDANLLRPRGIHADVLPSVLGIVAIDAPLRSVRSVPALTSHVGQEPFWQHAILIVVPICIFKRIHFVIGVDRLVAGPPTCRGGRSTQAPRGGRLQPSRQFQAVVGIAKHISRHQHAVHELHKIFLPRRDCDFKVLGRQRPNQVPHRLSDGHHRRFRNRRLGDPVRRRRQAVDVVEQGVPPQGRRGRALVPFVTLPVPGRREHPSPERVTHHPATHTANGTPLLESRGSPRRQPERPSVRGRRTEKG